MKRTSIWPAGRFVISLGPAVCVGYVIKACSLAAVTESVPGSEGQGTIHIDLTLMHCCWWRICPIRNYAKKMKNG